VTLNLTITPQMHTDFTPRITVIGVGGGGTNAVNTMIAQNLQGVEFVVANTDAQSLMNSRADRRIQLGPYLTQGLGAGAKPEIGRAAAEEATDEVYRHLDGTHMVFITAGMGGGTGTGAAPVIARMAKERNILTVGVVTKPFTFEGVRRTRASEQGIEDLQQYVDTLIVIPNQNLFRLANDRTSFREAFKMADNVLYMGVRGVTDLMVSPGLINLDFADIRTVMAEMGKAMMGTGEADGEGRALRAAEGAINNPLLEDMSMTGARGLLVNITGGEDLTLFEVDEATNRIRQEVDPEVNLIFGTAIDDNMNGRIRVSVVATGIDNEQHKVQARIYEVRPDLSLASAVGQSHAPQPVVQEMQPTLRNGPAPRPAPQPQGQPARSTAPAGRSLPQQPLQQPAPRAQAMVQPRQAEAMPLQGYETAVIDDAPMPPRQIPKHLGTPIPMQPPRPDPRGQARPAAPRPTLFAAPAAAPGPEPLPASPRKSIFNIVTGALAGRVTEAVAEQPAPRPDPGYAEPPRAAQARTVERQAERQPGGEELGMEIPSFLRRQS
jgi:cell division protein FtsZ